MQADSIQQGAVEAATVGNEPASALVVQDGVQTADCSIGKDEVVPLGTVA
jgi:hypothetical protein